MTIESSEGEIEGSKRWLTVGRLPDDSLELILRGGFGKGMPVRGVSGASGP